MPAGENTYKKINAEINICLINSLRPSDNLQFLKMFFISAKLKTAFMKKLITCLFILVVINITANGQPGSLDPSFGKGGKVYFNYSTSDDANYKVGEKVFELSDGKVLVVFAAGINYMATRLLADGNIDRTYGNNGYSDILPFRADNAIIQSNGKIVISGSKLVTRPDGGESRIIILGRLGANGNIDSAFGSNGLLFLNNYFDLATTRPMVIQNDEKIIVELQTTIYSPNAVYSIVLIRLNPDGSFDNSFGNGGIASNSLSDLANSPNFVSLSINNENKIIAVGALYDYTTGQNSTVIIRFDNNGSLDNSFGTNGKQVVNLNPNSNINFTLKSSALQTDGKIVVAGYIIDYSTYPYKFSFFVARFLNDGTLDNSFNGTGSNSADVTGYGANSVAIQNDGKILLSGDGIVTARYNTDGTIDGNFGTGGKIIFNINGNNYNNANCLSVTNTDKILITGGENSTPYDCFVVKYNSNGDADNTFSGGGLVAIPLEGGQSDLHNLFKLPDGELLGVGTEVGSNSSQISFAKLLLNGTPDNSYGLNGKKVVAASSAYYFGCSQMQQDGKILVASSGISNILRFDNNGNPDPTFSVGGILTLPSIQNYYIQSILSIATQGNGKILVLASITSLTVYNEISFALYCFNQNGTPDLSFGVNGVTLLLAPPLAGYYVSQPRAFSDGKILIRNDGKIVVFGALLNQPPYSWYGITLYLARLNSDGSFDNSFGPGGTLLGGFLYDPNISGIILGDNKLLVNSGYTLMKFNEDGSPDNSFGTGGSLNTTTMGSYSNIKLQQDGKILKIGATSPGAYLLSRFNADGSVDTDFGDNGNVVVSKDISEIGLINNLFVDDKRAYAFGYDYVPFQSAAILAYKLFGAKLSCSSNANVSTDLGLCSATVTNIDPVLVPAKAVVTVNYSLTGATSGIGTGSVSGKTFNTGTTTVTYTLADDSTQHCSFTVTVTDNQNPSITCPSNITQNVIPFFCFSIAKTPNPVVSDNCGVSKLTWTMTGATTGNSPSTGINYAGIKVFTTGVTTITYTAADPSGNTSSCSFTVTVIDNFKPLIVCPSNITQTATGNSCSKNISVPNPTTFDNCGVTGVTWVMAGATKGNSPSTGINYVGTKSFNVGITTVTYTVKDAANNVTSCSFTVKVNGSSKCNPVGSISKPDATKETDGEIINNDVVKIYPNPSNQSFTLETSLGINEKLELHVFDMAGRLVEQSTSITRMPVQFGVNLRPGVYMVKVVKGKDIKTIKVMKL